MTAQSLAPRPPAREAGPDNRGWVYLYPGEVFAAAEPSRVTTILGTCVSVCVFDSVSAVGAINHYLLPYRANPGDTSGRYGDQAIRLLFKAVLSKGALQQRLQAKVFGAMRSSLSRGPDLGARNVECAVALLRDLAVPIVAMDVGGEHGRKLLFQTDTGDAWVKTL